MCVACLDSRVRICVFVAQFWKQLVGQPVTFADVEDIDSATKKFLHDLEHVEEQGVTEADWPDLADRLGLVFKVTDASGNEVDLVPGGRSIPVRWSARHEYFKLVRRFKVSEFSRQINAVMRGLATQVPRHLLCLFTWHELEVMVCGLPTVDLELLKRCTVYENGYNETHRTILLFWDALRSFTDEVRGYIEFLPETNATSHLCRLVCRRNACTCGLSGAVRGCRFDRKTSRRSTSSSARRTLGHCATHFPSRTRVSSRLTCLSTRRLE